eukprot:753840-Hanusia_phi.AAC.7
MAKGSPPCFLRLLPASTLLPRPGQEGEHGVVQARLPQGQGRGGFDRQQSQGLEPTAVRVRLSLLRAQASGWFERLVVMSSLLRYVSNRPNRPLAPDFKGDPSRRSLGFGEQAAR